MFVIGSGDYSAAMSGTDRTGTKRAHSLSPADQREVTAFYSAIDVFLDLSTFTIGFRYLALEALAHGTPAVVPDTVVVPSYSCGAVLRYQPGYMTEAVKQLRQVQSNPITYQSTAKACAAEFADAEATHALLHKQLSSIAKSA